MRGTRAKRLRKLAHPYIDAMDPDRTRSGEALRLFRIWKRGWAHRRRQIAATKMHPPTPPRRSMESKRLAAIKRGAEERAERQRIYSADPLLRAKPWMGIQRLRRVAAKRKGA